MKKFDYHHYVSMTVIIVAVLIITFFVFGPNANFFQGFPTPIDCDSVSDAPNAITFYKNADSDNDGLSDYYECIYGTNPSVADTDGDHKSDGKEVNAKTPTDPLTIN